jgi:prepilin-type N-terminal cleavage/methylation domain-containing protein
MKEGEESIMGKFLKNQQGLTLIEVLVSITLLGIVLTSFLSFFNQAYSYTKKNQDKTVGINVARNVLYYIEQQDYNRIHEQYFPSKNSPEKVKLTIENCKDPVFDSRAVCVGFFSSIINNVTYSTAVTLNSNVNDDVNQIKPDLAMYLTGVEVEVKWGNQAAKVRGLIKK